MKLFQKRYIKLALFLTCSFSCMQNGLSPCVALVCFSCCPRLDTLLNTFCWFVKGLFTLFFFKNVNTMKPNYPTVADVSSLISHSWCSFVLRACEAVCRHLNEIFLNVPDFQNKSVKYYRILPMSLKKRGMQCHSFSIRCTIMFNFWLYNCTPGIQGTIYSVFHLL